MLIGKPKSVIIKVSEMLGTFQTHTVNLSKAGQRQGYFIINNSSVRYPASNKGGKMLIYIYKLIDPRDNLPHYIGKTKNPKERLYIHKTNTDPHNPEKRIWMQELKDLGLAPIFEIIESVEEVNSYYRESYNIQQGFLNGWPLTNIHRFSAKEPDEQEQAASMERTKNIMARLFNSRVQSRQ